MPTAQALGAELADLRQKHGAWLASFKSADGGYDMSAEQVGEFNKRNDELAAKQAAYDMQLQVEKSAAENEAKLAGVGRLVKGEQPGETKDADLDVDTKAGMDRALKSALAKNAPLLGAIAKGGTGTVMIELGGTLKTLLQTTAIAPQADRTGVFGDPNYFGDVEPFFPHGQTGSKSIEYYIQTTHTNNAAAVAQGSAVTDSAYSWTLTTDPVETVQAWIPITHEAVADNIGLQSTVETTLATDLQLKSNNLILAGDGNTPNPTGVFIRTGFQTQAKGADPAMDAIHKAITLVEVTGDANANLIVMHPTDWQNIRLTRTTDGVYILGNPGDAIAPRLWGLPVVKSTGLGSAGTAGVVDTRWHRVVEREGLTVAISTEHSTYFTERKVALMLYRRFAVETRRPKSACTVTGL
jgi:HK97 family phage major capsid protein